MKNLITITSLVAAAAMTTNAFGAWATDDNGLPVTTDATEVDKPELTGGTLAADSIYTYSIGGETALDFALGEYDLKLVGVQSEAGGTAGQYALGNITGSGDIWFSQGRWRIDSGTLTSGTLYVQGGQLWIRKSGAISNDVVLGASTFVGAEVGFRNSALRVNANATLAGTTTLVEDAKISFQNGNSLTINKLTGKSNLLTSVHSNSQSTLKIVATNDFAGTIDLVSTVTLDWGTGTFGGLTGSGKVKGGNTLSIANNGGTNTFTGTVGASGSAVNLTLTGTGTQAFSGESYFGTVSVENGVTLDLSSGNVSLSKTITNSGTVTVNADTLFNLDGLTATDNVYTLVTGGTINGEESLTYKNFSKTGTEITGRTQVSVSNEGNLVLTLGSAYNDLVWANDDGAVWNTESTNKVWNRTTGETGTKYDFADGDSVTFNTADATVTVAGTVDAAAVTVSANTTFTTTTGETATVVVDQANLTTTGTLTIDSGITLDLGTWTSNETFTKNISGTGTVKLVRGVDNHSFVINLGTDFNGILDYSGKFNATKSVVEGALGADATIALSTSSYGGSIWGSTDANPTINYKILFKGDYQLGDSSDSKFTFGKDVSANEGTTVTAKSNATVIFNGNAQFDKLSGSGNLTFSGATTDIKTLNISGGTATLSGTSSITVGALENWSTLKLENGVDINVTNTAELSKWSTSSKGVKNLNIGADSVLTVNGTATNDSGLALTNNGVLKVNGELKYLSDPAWTYNSFAGDGVVFAKKLIVGNLTQLVLENNTFVFGGASDGIGISKGNSGALRLGKATIGAQADWTSSMDMGLKGGDNSPTINTGTFDENTKTFSNETGHTITLSGVLSDAEGETGKLIKDGAGTLVLSGKNTYSGGTEIRGGTLKIDSAGWGEKGNLGTLFSSDGLKISNGGVLEVTAAQTAEGNSNDYGTGGALRGFSVTEGKGTYRYSGTTDSLISEGETNQRIEISSGATLVFDVVNANSTLTVSKVAQGYGALEINGAGTVVLSGTNTYTGGTTVSAGTLQVGSTSALGSGTVKIDGGQLDVASVSLSVSALEIVLSDKYKSDGGVAAITGTTGSITLDLNKQIVLSKAEEIALENITDLSFKIENADFSMSEDDFMLDNSWGNWFVSGYDSSNGVITLSVPEPSMFGLLAGLGALALVGARRRRKTK